MLICEKCEATVVQKPFGSTYPDKCGSCSTPFWNENRVFINTREVDDPPPVLAWQRGDYRIVVYWFDDEEGGRPDFVYEKRVDHDSLGAPVWHRKELNECYALALALLRTSEVNLPGWAVSLIPTDSPETK